MANYQYINSAIAPADGNCAVPLPLEGAGPGQRIVAWTLVVLPTAYLDANLLSRVSICIGGKDARPARLRDGMSWSAPIVGGEYQPELGGLFLVGDNAMASIKGLEFYVEFVGDAR